MLQPGRRAGISPPGPRRVADSVTTPARPGIPTEVGARAVAFEAFYRSEYHSILTVIRLLTADRSTAEDVVQESFAAAYDRWETLSAYDRPGAWVRRVALNRAVSGLRRRRTERRALERLGTRAAAAEPGADAPDDELWAAVRRLPARQAQVVALVYVEDRTVADVADILGCRAGSVKQHLTRARARLAATLAPDAQSGRRGRRSGDD
jgi:RNA polymerase sigma-70 factor (ECF subfamily)